MLTQRLERAQGQEREETWRFEKESENITVLTWEGLDWLCEPCQGLIVIGDEVSVNLAPRLMASKRLIPPLLSYFMKAGNIYLQTKANSREACLIKEELGDKGENPRRAAAGVGKVCLSLTKLPPYWC